MVDGNTTGSWLQLASLESFPAAYTYGNGRASGKTRQSAAGGSKLEVVRGIGNEREGGYKFRARAPCLTDATTMSDAQVLQRFLDHNKKKCPCYPEGK